MILGKSHNPAWAAVFAWTAWKYSEIWKILVMLDANPKKLTRYEDINVRLTIILRGANGSFANTISTVQKKMNRMANVTREMTVIISDQEMLPALSKPNRRKNMEETRVKAPRKSTRFSLGQRSPVEDFGSWSTKVTADIAIAVSGTWRKKDLRKKLGDYLIEY